MVSTKVALIYVYTVPFEYLLNDMFKRDFISRLYQVFLWLFFNLCVGKMWNVLSFMNIHIYIFIWCIYFYESHSSQNKHIPVISSIWPGQLLWFVDFRDIEGFQLGHHALLVELLWKVAQRLQCMKIPQANHSFFCNWHLILGSSGWFTRFTIEMEKMKFGFTLLHHFPFSLCLGN